MEWDEWLTAALALTFGIGAVVLAVRSVLRPASADEHEDCGALPPQLVVPMLPSEGPERPIPAGETSAVAITANPLAKVQ